MIEHQRYLSNKIISNPKVNWKYKIGGNVISSPAAIGGLVYLGSLFVPYSHHKQELIHFYQKSYSAYY